MKASQRPLFWVIFPFFLVGFNPYDICPDEVSEVKRIAPKYNAEVEVRLWDLTRVDMLTKEYAIEVDWAPKWAEGIGQALYYAQVTGKKPGVILLIKDIKKEARFVYRLQIVAAKYDIKVWLEKVEDD